jgi:hypothetical protein
MSALALQSVLGALATWSGFIGIGSQRSEPPSAGTAGIPARNERREARKSVPIKLALS